MGLTSSLAHTLKTIYTHKWALPAVSHTHWKTSIHTHTHTHTQMGLTSSLPRRTEDSWATKQTCVSTYLCFSVTLGHQKKVLVRTSVFSSTNFHRTALTLRVFSYTTWIYLFMGHHDAQCDAACMSRSKYALYAHKNFHIHKWMSYLLHTNHIYVYICMYECVRVCVYIYIYIYIYICAHIATHSVTHTPKHTHIPGFAYIHTLNLAETFELAYYVIFLISFRYRGEMKGELLPTVVCMYARKWAWLCHCDLIPWVDSTFKM